MATSISTTLAAGSVAQPYYYKVNITKQLCRKTCSNNTPVFYPSFYLVSSTLVGTNQYEITINVQGSITYTPCGTCDCCARTQLVNENFIIPLYSTSAPESIILSGNVISNKILTSGCSNCGNVFVSDCALTINITNT